MKKRNKHHWQDVHGLILLNKPQGISSNLALQKARRIFNAKKAGHTGSLDPMATGLLPCCFGDATKVAGLMLNASKTYIAQCKIGSETDTGDATGETTKTSHIKHLNDQEIKHSTAQLTGEISQIPPMYSALHHNGQRLYQLARAGKNVERAPRQVTIHQFTTLKVTENDEGQLIDFEITVSKGTYIRTLLEDLAKLCGSYAHMTQLHRVQLGILNDPKKMLTLEQLQQTDNPHDLLLPMDTALIEYDQVQLNGEQIQRLIHGLQIHKPLSENIYRIYDHNNRFVGLGEALKNGQFKVKNLFLKSYQHNTQ